MIRNLLLVSLVAASLSGLLAGCNPVSVGALGLDASREVVDGQNWDEGIIDTKADRWNRINLIRDIEDRGFRDDLDMIFLADHSTGLTEWHPQTH
jgi:hypothetical protein